MQRPHLPYPCVAWVCGFLFSPSNQLCHQCSRVAVWGCFLFSTIGGWHILILFTDKSRLFLCRSVSLFNKLGCLFACNIVMLSVPLACTNPRNKLTNIERWNEIHRLNRLHRLIKMCNTGAPDELAQRLHASKRHIYNVQNELRALDARNDYSHSDYTFYSLIWIKVAMKAKSKSEKWNNINVLAFITETTKLN